MNFRFLQSGQAAAMLLAAFASVAVAADQPAVKRSKNKICHELGSPGYDQTLRFTSFNSIEACLKAGGRLPKNLTFNKPRFDPSEPAHPGEDGVLFGPLVRVIDGDTIVVKVQGAALRVRL